MAPHPFLSQRSLNGLIRQLVERRRVAADMVAAFSAEAREALLTADNSDRFDDECQIGTGNDESFALASNAYALVNDIDAALQRLASGVYGFCRACGDEIPYRRLKAVPATSLCFECSDTRVRGDALGVGAQA